MAVKVEDLKDGAPVEKRRRSPAMFSQGGVISVAIGVLRIIAVLLLIGSAFGNYVQFIGGWDMYWPINWAVVGYAVIYQAIFSVLQWGFKALGWWFAYTLVLIASAVPSFLTYNGLFGPYLTAQIGTIPAMIGIGIAMMGGDALPEWVLVE